MVGMSRPRLWILRFLTVIALWAVAVPTTAAVDITLLAHSNYKAGFDTLIERFNNQHKAIRVEPIYIAGDALVQEKFLTLAAGGVSPDVLWHYNASLFASNGVVMPLEVFIEKESSVQQFVADFVGGLAGRYTYQGEIYALPFGVNTGFMPLYNKAKFSLAGLPEPKDGWRWDEFLPAARRLTVDANADGTPEQWGFDTPSQVIFPWMYSVGSEPFCLDRREWYADIEATREALDHAVSLVWEYGVTPFPAKGWRKFTEGESAMYAEGNYVYGWIQTMGSLPFEVGVVNWPIVRNRKLYLGGYGLFLGRSGDPQREGAAWEFARWAAQPEQQLTYTTITKQLPSTISTIRHRDFRSWLAENPVVGAFMNETSQYGTPQLVPIGYLDGLQLTEKWATSALNGSLSVQAAVEGLKKAIGAVYSATTIPIL